MKVLVTGAQGDIAEAACRVIMEAFPAAELHGSDMGGDDWPLAVGFAALHRLPAGEAPEYAEALCRLHGEQGYDVILPLTEGELRGLNARRGAVAHLPLLMHGEALLDAFLDKLDTARWLEGRGFAAPFTVPLREARPEHLPLLVKPRRGHGSRGIEVVRDAAHLAFVQAARRDDAVAQELLEPAEAEFTCVAFRVRATGEVRTLQLRRRLSGGLTGQARVELHPEIEALLHGVALAADLDGSLNLQLRLTERGPRVFEVNPRFSSTVMMRHRIGFQDLVWALRAREGETGLPDFVPPVGTRIHRLSRELVIAPRGTAGLT